MSSIIKRINLNAYVKNLGIFIKDPQSVSMTTNKSNALNNGLVNFQSRKNNYFFTSFYKGNQESSITLHCCQTIQAKYGKIKSNTILSL